MKSLITKYLKYSLILVLLFTYGCIQNLEEQPKSIISSVTYYKTDAEFLAAINGALHAHVNGWGAFDFNAPHLLCAGAEDYTSRETAPELKQYDELKTLPTAPAVISMWNNLYIAINLSNAIIEKAPEALEVSESNRLIYEAQARYIRALDYFYLTRWFGEVIIITPENAGNAENLTQSPVSDIYDLIIEDLKFAEQNLPLTFPGQARPTKGAAKTLLAEVYLNMTGWPLKDASKYALARDKAKEVMDLEIYSLEPNFGDLWLAANKFTNHEFIFIFNGDDNNYSTATHMHEAQRPGEEGGWNDLMTEARFFYAFPDGPRKDYSFWTVFADAAHTHWEDSRIGQPFIAKYRDAPPTTRDQGVVSSYSGDGFFPVSRYAEVLLIYAEAANMAEGEPSELALECINQVRRRAGGYDQLVYADLPEGMSQTDFNTAVIEERAWELAFECKRWFDLVRTEQVVSANIDLYPNVTTDNQLLPKPATEVALIEGLEQNPGYN